MATQIGYGRAYYRIDVLESSGRKVPLGPDVLRLINSVEVEQVWDGADQISLVMVAWDERAADFRIVGEDILAPGVSIILRAGYGAEKPTTIGRFTIAKHQPSFTSGTPTVTITGYDGFAQFMDNTYPGDYGGASDGLKTYTDVAVILARKYGYGIAADVSTSIPFTTKTKRVRKRRNGKVVRVKGKVQRTNRKVHSKIIKNAGDTDAKMIKDLANYSGFLLPKVRYVEGDGVQVTKLHAVTERLRDRDVLFFRRASIRRQLTEGDAFDFAYSKRSGDPSTLQTFDPTWNSDDVPMSVRVTGIVRETVGKSGTRVRKRIHVVEAQLTEPEQLRQRDNLLRRAAREKDPAKAKALRAKAAVIGPNITVVRSSTTQLLKKDKKRFRNAGTAMIEVLDKARTPVREYDRVAKRKVQTMRREVIGRTMVVNDSAELIAIAKGWLSSRLSLHITATATLTNIRQAQTVYPNQVHTASGLSAEYVGAYMVRTATHVWNSGSGHTVSTHLQRVAEAPSVIGSKESTDD